MMKRTLFVAVLMLLWTAPLVCAQVAIDEALTVDATVGGVAIAAATHSPANQDQAVFCTGKLETAAIRVLDNGDAPTSTVGTPVLEDERVDIFGHNFIVAARFIRTTGVSGLIHFTCYPNFPVWATP